MDRPPTATPTRRRERDLNLTESTKTGEHSSGDVSYQFPSEPPAQSTFREQIERTFKRAEERYSDIWRADPDDLYAFLEATDSSSPPERLFLIQLYRAAGKQMKRGVTVPDCRSEWYLEIAAPEDVRHMLKGWSTEIWLQLHAQQMIELPGRGNQRMRKCFPDFLVKVQVNDDQSGHYGAGRRVTHTPIEIAVEVDGRKYHYDDKTDIEKDVDRHNRFAASGIQSIRCNAWQVNSSERGDETDIGGRTLSILWDMAQREVLEPSL